MLGHKSIDDIDKDAPMTLTHGVSIRPASRWGYLGNAFVLAEHRSRGVGTALPNALVAHAQDRGCVRMVLSPTDRSMPFYHKAEFGPATMLLARILGS